METPTIEVRAAALFRQAGRAEPLTPEQLESVWTRTAPRLRKPSLARWVGGGAVVALAAASMLIRAPTHPLAREVPTEVSAAPRLPPPVPTPTVPTTPLAQPPTQVRVAPRATARIPAPVEAEDPLLAESRLLARALSELRDQENAEAALASLDEYAARFEHGVLRSEATLTRIEALIVTQKRMEALALLESLDLSATPRGEELRVLLGELMLEAGRRESARRQFELALEGRLVREAEDRAMYGLACSLDEKGAFERYLLRFPRGRFAEAARARLDED